MSAAKKFYRLFSSDDFGVAMSSPEVGVDLIPAEGEIPSWTPPELVVERGEYEGPVADYANSDVVGGRLCSKRLKRLLDKLRSEEDKVQWLPAYVTDLTGDRMEYFLLHFPELSDVLDLEPGGTIYDDDILIRPCLSRWKIGGRKLFNIAGLEIATVVEQCVKDALEAAEITGLDFHGIHTRD